MELKEIILVDDHVIVRNGLRELIEKIGPYKITREFDTGTSFLDFISGKQKADLVILDHNMPGMNGEEVLEKMNLLGLKVPVLVLTLNTDEEVIIHLFRSGARGYLQKNCSAQILRQALEEIFRCGYYHNEFLSLSLRTNGAKPELSEQQKILESLSPREKEFLKWVCHEKEYTYDQIADLMKVQHRTVDGYREALFEKFGIKSKTGLVLFVLKHNLFGQL